MVQFIRGSSGLWGLTILALLLAQAGSVACSNGGDAPPPVFSHPKGDGGSGNLGGAGGAGGETSTNCTAKRKGCDCDSIGITTPCKVTETFDDYVTCTVGVLTCQDDLTWGQCIGERTTTPASTFTKGNRTRGN